MPRVTSYLSALVSALALMVLAACTATPLYQAEPATGATSANYAKSIDFEAPSSRVEQVVRNRMIFRLFGGQSEPTAADYTGRLAVTSSNTGIFRTSTTSVGQTSAALITVTGTLTVVDTQSGEVVRTFERSTIAPIDKGNQEFANERAVRDAENRAAEQLAEQFATLLASNVLR